MDYKKVYSLIRQALKDKNPIAINRLGDGESLLISTTKDHTPSRLNWWLNNQLGYIPDRDIVLEIKELVLEGYKNSDVIGVPTKVHRERHGKFWRIAESKLEELVPSTKDIPKGSIDLHTELLVSGLLHQLIKSQKELIYVSCRHLDDRFKDRFNLDKVTSYHLTEEQRYAVKKVKSKYYPEEFNAIVKFIDNADCEGKLCLVGAGMLGKYYTHKFKQAGGIAVDLGNVFDKLAGLKTRGAGKGAGVIDETYKL